MKPGTHVKIIEDASTFAEKGPAGLGMIRSYYAGREGFVDEEEKVSPGYDLYVTFGEGSGASFLEYEVEII